MSCLVSLPSHGAVLSCLLISGPTALFFQVLRWEAWTHPCSLSPPAGFWLTFSDSRAYSSPPWFLCPSAIQSGQSVSHPLLIPAVGFCPPTCSPHHSHKLTWSDTSLSSSSLCSAILSPGFLLHRGGRWPATTSRVSSLP